MLQALGILESTLTILSLAHFLSTFTVLPPQPSPKPPWSLSQRNDAFHADIAGLLVLLLALATLSSCPDPYLSAREYPTPHFPPPIRPPPDPDPVSLHHPLSYEVSMSVHHASLHCLAHLHQLESSHLRLLALHRRLPLRRPPHLLLQFCPTLPFEASPPWTDEGGSRQ